MRIKSVLGRSGKHSRTGLHSRRRPRIRGARRRVTLAAGAVGACGALAAAAVVLWAPGSRALPSDQDALIGTSPAAQAPAGGPAPTSLPTTASASPAPSAGASTPLASPSPSPSPVQAAAPVPAAEPGGVSVAQEESVLQYALAQLGKPYSLNNRFGPVNFDCSGLVWAALRQAGVPVPDTDTVVSTEMTWLMQVPGAEVIKSSSGLAPGDIVAMAGSDPYPTPYGPEGHIGFVASGHGSSAVILSAYDTAEGVNETSLSQNGGFTLAVRPQGGSGLTG